MSVRVSHTVQIPEENDGGFRLTRVLQPCVFVPLVAVGLVVVLFIRTLTIVSAVDTARQL